MIHEKPNATCLKWRLASISEHRGRPRALGACNVRPLVPLRGHDRGERHRQRSRHHGSSQVTKYEKGKGGVFRMILLALM